jgi:hypothetical protein
MTVEEAIILPIEHDARVLIADMTCPAGDIDQDLGKAWIAVLI